MKKNKATNKNEKIKKQVWRSFSYDQYLQAASTMVHFSAKAVNSNTLSYGIRIGKNEHLNLPYVALSTLQDKHLVPLDYVKNVGSTSPLVKQINAVRHQKLDRFANIADEDLISISQCFELLNERYEPEESIGIRLRQIILQDLNGNDISATPLPCAGMSVLINNRIKEEVAREKASDNQDSDKVCEVEDTKQFIPRKKAYLGLGGTQSQNIGLNIYAMKNPLMFPVPTLENNSPDLRHALSIYYKGMPIKPNLTLLKEFIHWQHKMRLKYFSSPTDLNIRNTEKSYLVALTKDFMLRVSQIEKLLHENQQSLPENKKFAQNLPDIQQGLLDSTLRTQEWKSNFAYFFHSKIINEYIWIDGIRLSILGNKNQTAGWIRVIKEALL